MRVSFYCASLALIGTLAQAARAAEVRVDGERRIRFTEGWRFAKGEAQGAERAEYVDSAWRELDLPHDWAIEGPFDKQYSPQCGGLPFYGVAWYRKHFTLPATAKGKCFSIEFDGAMSNSRVWLNGKELGQRPYGYISFAYDLTPELEFGAGENVLAVRLAPVRSPGSALGLRAEQLTLEPLELPLQLGVPICECGVAIRELLLGRQQRNDLVTAELGGFVFQRRHAFCLHHAHVALQEQFHPGSTRTHAC